MTISYITEFDLVPYFGIYGYARTTITNGDYLYIGGTGYNDEWDEIAILDIWDISTPASPVHEKTISWGPSYAIHDFAIKDDRLYMAAPDYYGAAGIYVYDISDPTNPSYVDMIAGAGSPNYLYYVEQVCIEGDYLYASATSEKPNYIVIFDISDPDSITLTNAVYVEDRAPREGVFLYEFTVRDGIGYGHVDGYRLSWPILASWDLTNPLNPVYLWTSTTGVPSSINNGIHNIFLSGDTMLVAHWWNPGGAYYSYFRTWDISDPANIIFLETIPADFIGSGVPGVYFLGGIFHHLVDNYIITSDTERFTIFDISNPSAVSFVESSYDTDFGDSVSALSLKDNVGYYIQSVYSEPILKVISLSDYISIGIEVGDNVLLIPNYNDIYDRAAIKGGDISVGDNVNLYPLKAGAKVAIKEEWSAGDKIIF